MTLAETKRMLRGCCVAILMAVAMQLSGCVHSIGKTTPPITPANLRCEYQRDPMGVDVAAPRLFWQFAEGQAQGQRQTACQVLVASSEALLNSGKGDLWDSGKLATDQTIQLPYKGKPLGSGQQVFWKVRSWDKNGKPGDWSATATWTMGLLTPADWKARWISGADEWETVLLRKEFEVKPGLKRAVAFVCGLGQYEMTLNGGKVGNDILSPGWTDFKDTCLYDTHDVTAALMQGRNAVGIELGNGMMRVVKGPGRFAKFTNPGKYCAPVAICQIQLTYANGTTEIVGSDESWRVLAGPITYSNIYSGEDYDPRLEPAGWKTAGFDDKNWPAARVTDGPGGKLAGWSCSAPPLRAIESFKPVDMVLASTNTMTFDFGQNASMMPKVTVTGPAGSVVRMTAAELMTSDGLADRQSCGGKRGTAYWEYTLTGKGEEVWFPKFFYHGARYVQVDLIPAEQGAPLPKVVSIESVVVHSSSEPIGEFACSNELFNRIRTLVRWAQRSNMVSLLTDCPHREKLGWLEQDHLNGPSLRYEFNLANMFTKAMNDMQDAQLDNGFVPNIAPEYTEFKGNFRDSPEWGSAAVLAPWQQYLFDGDVEMLRRFYPVIKGYVDYLGTMATDHLLDHGLSDWYDIVPGGSISGPSKLTTANFSASAFYCYDAATLAKIAKILGNEQDAKTYAELSATIRQKINAKLYNPSTAQYDKGSQCANSMALVMGLADPANRAAVVENIVKDVQTNALTAGDVGYQYLVLALAEGGRSDVLYELNNQSDTPGYGYQLKRGATSLTEAWNARASSSQNHFMLGQIIEWFYGYLAGIQPDPAAPGFKNVILKPTPTGDLTWVKAHYDSLYGRIAVRWDRKDGQFTLTVTIPANTTATVYVPSAEKGKVTIDGAAAKSAPGVKFVKREGDRAVYTIESGTYQFTSKY